jgi:hypothetical protein
VSGNLDSPCRKVASDSRFLREVMTRTIGRHRDKLVRFRAAAMNPLLGLAMRPGLCREKKLSTPAGRKELEALSPDPWDGRAWGR